MAVLTLNVPTTAASGVAFTASVSITSGPPNADVTVTVEQPKGGAGSFSRTQKLALDATGAGGFGFDVVLNGKGFKTLLAHAVDDSGTFYKPDAETVEVV